MRWQMFTTTSQAPQHFVGTLATQRIAASRWPPSVKHRCTGVRVSHDFKVTNSGRPSLIVPSFYEKKKHEMNRNEIVSKRKPLLENIYIWSHTLKSWFLPRISLVFPQRHRGRDDVRHPAFRIRITHSRFSMVIPVVRRPANPLELPSLSASSARRRHCSASRLGLETKENQVVHGWKVFNNLDSLKTCPKVHVDGYGFPQMLVIHHMTQNATLKNRNSQGII